MSQNYKEDSANETQSASVDHGLARLMVERACIRWEADLKGFLLGVLRDSHLAEDVFQKTVIKAMGAADSVRQETLRGWLFQVALNEARQHQREHIRDVKHREKLAEQLATEQQSRLTARDSQWMQNVGALNAELVDAIRESVSKLSPDQQQVIQMRVSEGLTFAEIATRLDQPLGTVLTWMRRGLERLRQDRTLQGIWDPEEFNE